MSTPVYSIRDWDTHFENSRSRAVAELRWVSMPNKHDGEGYGLVMEQDDAAELFSAWVLIVQVASKCQVRGTLTRDDGSPLTARSLAMKTRAPEAWFAKALKFFTEKTLWLECRTPDSEPSPTYHPVITQPSPSHQVSADRMEGNGIEEKRKEGKPACLSSETYVSSPPTVLPEEAGRQAAPNFSEKEEEPEALPSIPTETAFLSAARKMGIPEAYAVVAYAELVGRGWKTADGSPVVSFAAVLKAGWDREQAKPSRTNPGEPRKREHWMVEADMKRIKAEVKRITDDPASRYASKGYSATWEQHQDQFREAWLAVVRACHDEAREKLPEDFRAFEASLSEAREEMRKGAAMLGQDPKTADSEDVRLAHFVTFFPDDCPDFARWDREWNRAKSWRDPKGLTEDAKTEIKILKSQLSALENERRALLVGAG